MNEQHFNNTNDGTADLLEMHLNSGPVEIPKDHRLILNLVWADGKLENDRHVDGLSPKHQVLYNGVKKSLESD